MADKKRNPSRAEQAERARRVRMLERFRDDSPNVQVAPKGISAAALRAADAWLDELREEARYRRERLELYRGRMYAGRAGNENRLRAYQRSSDGATARLRHAESTSPRPTPDDPQP
jgi:hypothetical protein